jgi:hypothetical protein
MSKLSLYFFVFTMILTSVFVTTYAEAKSYDYQLDNGRRAPISIETNAKTTDWLVLMPGSGCGFYEIKDSHFLTWLKAKREYNILLIGKAGSDLGKDDNACRVDEFQHSSVRSQRITDVHTIMRDLIPSSARILLTAISEGAYIAPDIALEDARVKAYIDLSGNSKSWMDEEIMCVSAGAARDKLEKFFDDEVRGNNSFTKYYSDWTYAYLNSYDTHRTYDVFKQLEIPVIWLNGDNDETLWVEGARQDAMALINKEGKTNIEYHWLAGANHGLQCADTAPSCDKAKLNAQVEKLITDFAEQKF